jgi:hypothetical protein
LNYFLGSKVNSNIGTIDHQSSNGWVIAVIYDQNNPDITIVIARSYDFFQRSRSMSFYKNDCHG